MHLREAAARRTSEVKQSEEDLACTQRHNAFLEGHLKTLRTEMQVKRKQHHDMRIEMEDSKRSMTQENLNHDVSTLDADCKAAQRRQALGSSLLTNLAPSSNDIDMIPSPEQPERVSPELLKIHVQVVSPVGVHMDGPCDLTSPGAVQDKLEAVQGGLSDAQASVEELTRERNAALAERDAAVKSRETGVNVGESPVTADMAREAAESAREAAENAREAAEKECISLRSQCNQARKQVSECQAQIVLQMEAHNQEIQVDCMTPHPTTIMPGWAMPHKSGVRLGTGCALLFTCLVACYCVILHALWAAVLQV